MYRWFDLRALFFALLAVLMVFSIQPAFAWYNYQYQYNFGPGYYNYQYDYSYGPSYYGGYHYPAYYNYNYLYYNPYSYYRYDPYYGPSRVVYNCGLYYC